MYESQSALIIEMAKRLMEFMGRSVPSWRVAYYRLARTSSEVRSNGSYLDQAGVTLIGAVQNEFFYADMESIGVELLQEFGKGEGVILLIAKADFSYDVKFEFDNLDRWKITKLDGGTGIPEGESPL